jgi:MFS family permease
MPSKQPEGVRVLTYATAVRWFGWGFAESLIPIFIFSFCHSYTQAGLIKSSYDIVFILTLPLAGMAADRFKATSLILLGLMLYIFVGISFLLAGITGLIIFLVIARGLNGFTYALDAVGRETYFMRYVPHEKIASVFGYFDSISNFWWVFAGFFGMVLVKFFSIQVLLFLITPTSVIALVMVWVFRGKEPEIVPKENQSGFHRAYKETFNELVRWDWKLKTIAMFNFFISVAAAVVAFFLPIEAYESGAGLQYALLIGIMFTIPYLFGWFLGKWFDIKGIGIFFYGLFSMAVLLFSLAFFQNHIWQICAAFGLGIVFELLTLGSNELVSIYAEPEHFGRINGAMLGIDSIGSFVGPLSAGVLIDAHGVALPYFILGILMLVLAVAFYIFKNKFSFAAETAAPAHLHKKLHRIR